MVAVRDPQRSQMPVPSKVSRFSLTAFFLLPDELQVQRPAGPRWVFGKFDTGLHRRRLGWLSGPSPRWKPDEVRWRFGVGDRVFCANPTAAGDGCPAGTTHLSEPFRSGIIRGHDPL